MNRSSCRVPDECEKKEEYKNNFEHNWVDWWDKKTISEKAMFLFTG